MTKRPRERWEFEVAGRSGQGGQPHQRRADAGLFIAGRFGEVERVGGGGVVEGGHALEKSAFHAQGVLLGADVVGTVEKAEVKVQIRLAQERERVRAVDVRVVGEAQPFQPQSDLFANVGVPLDGVNEAESVGLAGRREGGRPQPLVGPRFQDAVGLGQADGGIEPVEDLGLRRAIGNGHELVGPLLRHMPVDIRLRLEREVARHPLRTPRARRRWGGAVARRPRVLIVQGRAEFCRDSRPPVGALAPSPANQGGGGC